MAAGTGGWETQESKAAGSSLPLPAHVGLLSRASAQAHGLILFFLLYILFSSIHLSDLLLTRP